MKTDCEGSAHRSTGPGASAIAGSILGIAAVWSLVDAVQLVPVVRAEQLPAGTWVWGGLLLTGLAAGLAITLAVAALGATGWWLFTRKGGPPHPWLSCIPLVVAAGWPLWGAIDDTLSGPWISTQHWVDGLAWTLRVAGVLGLWLVCRGGWDLVCGSRRAGLRPLGLLALGTVMLIIADLRYLPLYTAFHAALQVAATVAAGLLGAGVAMIRPRSAWRGVAAAAVVAGGLGAVLLVTRAIPGTDPVPTYLLRTRAPWTARLLQAFLPETVASGHVPEEIWREITASTAVDGAVLDRCFPERRKWNVVMVTIDALRADRTGFMGYAGARTPNLDALAAESVVFERAYSQYPSSSLAMATMFKGLYPSGVDVHRRTSGQEAAEDPSLADRLRAGGRYTRGVTAIRIMALAYLSQGFDAFVRAPGPRYLDAAEITERARRSLDELPETPWFLWVHLFDPHAPYLRHPETAPDDRPSTLYEGEIAFVDRHLGPFLESLRARPDWDRTLVVVNSDHGEEFLEHGSIGHDSTVYEEQVRVPLLFRVPGSPARRVGHVVELVDLVPTVLDLLDLPPLARSHGHSLAGLLLPPGAAAAGTVRLPPDAAFCQILQGQRVNGNLDALRRGPYKLIENRNTGTFQLFDLDEDPGEQHNLALRAPELLAEMRPYLSAYQRLAADGAIASQAQSSTLARLRAHARERRGADRLRAVGELVAVGHGDAAAVLIDELFAACDDGAERQILVEAAIAFGLEPPGVLGAVARDRDPRVRAAGALLVGMPNARGGAARDVLGDDRDPGVIRATAIARGLRGDTEARADVERSLDIESEPYRDLALVALARLGSRDAADDLAMLLEWNLLRPLAQSVALEFFAEHAETRSLAPLYRLLLRHDLGRLGSERALRAGIRHPDDGLPLVRRALLAPQPSVRRDAETWLRSHGRTHLLTPLRIAEARLQSARSLAAVALDPDRAARAYAAVCDDLDRQGIPDWGAAQELWSVLIAAKRPQDAARLHTGDTGDSPLARDLAARLRQLATTLDRPPRATLALEQHDSAIHPGRAPLRLRFRLELDASGGGLTGGLPRWMPFLAIVARAPGHDADMPLAILSLPPEGLLPDEHGVFQVLIHLPELSPGTYRISMSLRMGTEVLAKGFSVEYTVDG